MEAFESERRKLDGRGATRYEIRDDLAGDRTARHSIVALSEGGDDFGELRNRTDYWKRVGQRWPVAHPLSERAVGGLGVELGEDRQQTSSSQPIGRRIETGEFDRA